ncbi:diphosphomevalonate decarboxylase [bacterium]|nr:diphosphomevalonate decarboxylase [bacterium]
MQSVTVLAPSNIALVKYWGKKEGQRPWNPSVSFTLSSSCTQTELRWEPGLFGLSFWFEAAPKPAFLPKLEQFFDRLAALVPEIREHRFEIRSQNSFPHSSGIASSASAFAALGLGLSAFRARLDPVNHPIDVHQASSWARLGSGSAARSIEGPVVLWGETEHCVGSNSEYGVRVEDVHPVFKNYRDTILLIETGSKSVSSTHGHALMNGHAFGPARVEMAHRNTADLLRILATGDVEGFVDLVESEALVLHALMMSSVPGYLLMRPNTLAAIEQVRAFRRDTGVPLCFTLDAGANVHLLYPEDFEQTVHEFVTSTLSSLCAKGAYLCDALGTGAKILNTNGLIPA